jgi:hypothetical protein
MPSTDFANTRPPRSNRGEADFAETAGLRTFQQDDVLDAVDEFGSCQPHLSELGHSNLIV